MDIDDTLQERSGNLLLVAPVAAGEIIFDGALIAIDNSGGASDGRVINWRDDNTPITHFFLGIARVTDRTLPRKSRGEARTGNSAGSVLIEANASGLVLRTILVAGSVLADRGALVFASDENSFSTTSTPAGNPVGWIVQISVPGTADVKLFSAGQYRAHRDV